MPKRPTDSRKNAPRRAEHPAAPGDLGNGASEDAEAPPRPRMGRPPSAVKRVSTSFTIRPEHSENLRLGALLRGPAGTMSDILDELIADWSKRNEAELNRAREALRPTKLR
jgi:hypothetical protein